MKSKLLASTLMVLVFAACGGAPEPNDNSDGPGLVIGGEGTDDAVSSLYQMPTPNELFSLVRDLAGDGQKRMLNPASNVDRYASLSSRAFNFGVYSTDLVYASYFKLNVEVARYYLTSKKLAESLGISSAFSDADFVRLEANLTRGDSLEVISNDAYTKAYSKLQDEEMGATLSLVLAGGWVESMHLLFRQIDTFGKNEALLTRVAEQKVTLEHLIDLMEPQAGNADVAAMQQELLAIRDVYDQVNVIRVAHKGTSASGRMILGEDVQMEMTEEKYLSLVQAVEDLRTRMTAPEDKTNA
jgi:hypothetical protein